MGERKAGQSSVWGRTELPSRTWSACFVTLKYQATAEPGYQILKLFENKVHLKKKKKPEILHFIESNEMELQVA